MLIRYILFLIILSYFNTSQILVIPGEGMPNSKNPSIKDNLIIKFDVEFPSGLSDEDKKCISDLLP